MRVKLLITVECEGADEARRLLQECIATIEYDGAANVVGLGHVVTPGGQPHASCYAIRLSTPGDSYMLSFATGPEAEAFVDAAREANDDGDGVVTIEDLGYMRGEAGADADAVEQALQWIRDENA